MAEKFQPQTFDINSINNGDRFTLSDGITPEAVNAPIEAAAYMQALATNQPDNSEAGLIGQPNVSIEQAEDGTPRFKFSNLKAPDHLEKIEQIEKQTNDNSQQLNNLTAALLQNEILTMVEVEQAFVSRETADGENIVDGQYTEVTEIKGSTVKCENLIPYPYAETTRTSNGITFTDNGDGSITINGTATRSALFVLSRNLELKTETQYTINGGKNGIVVLARTNPNDANWIDSANGKFKTGTLLEGNTINYIGVYVAMGIVANNVTVYPMFNEGDTALPYQPYFTGLKNAYFKGIKSTGKNLFDISKIPNVDGLVNNGDGTLSISQYGAVTKKTLQEICPALKVGDVVTFSFITTATERQFIYLYSVENNIIWDNGTSKTITEDLLKRRLVFYPSSSTDLNATISNIQIEYGTTATAYEPYKEDIYELPEAVELGKWDSLNLQASELTKANGQIVLDGSNDENWVVYGSTETVARYWTDILDNIVDQSIKERGISNKFRFALSAKDIGTFYINGNDHNCCFNVDITQYPTVDDWKSHLTELYASGVPLIVVYKKVTATVENLENIPKSYQAWKNGSETVLQGDTDNSEYGAMPTVTTEYFKLTEV